MQKLKIYASRGQIVVEGVSGVGVNLYDLNGRFLATRKENYDQISFDVPISGTYIIKPEGFPAKKVVVIR